MIRARVVWLLACLHALPSTSAAESGRVGILPVTGDRVLGADLDPSLGRAVAERGKAAVLGPVEVQARLNSNRSVAEVLQRARDAIARAKDHELRMNRDAATRDAKEAIRLLRRTRAAYHQPVLVTQAYTAMALAQLLMPANIPRARRAFRGALAADPGYRPEPGQIPPRAAQILRQAGRQAKEKPPSKKDLAWIARRSRISRLLWLRLAPAAGEQRRKVQVLLYDHRRRQILLRLRKEIDPRRALAQIADLVVQALGGVDGRSGVTAVTASPPPSPASPGTAARPWYRRWWVWTLAGAVVAGTAVGVTLAVTRETSQPAPDGYDLHFHF